MAEAVRAGHGETSRRRRRVLVLTISDGVAHGTREDESGQALAARLAELGFEVERQATADEMEQIARAVALGADGHALVISTGGTGLGPRDVTPQTLHALLDYEVPGFGELMRAAGRASTPMADLSRSLAGVLGGTLVVAVPGSKPGAVESLAAIEPLLDHALETLGGRTEHVARNAAERSVDPDADAGAGPAADPAADPGADL